ncbi:MAG: hypothetical protein NTY19_52000 [Planctomycetota bacterium]|nr:hypothetical protein [Planctomycetota bacterium]
MTSHQSARRDFLRTLAATASVVAAPIFLPATVSGHATPEGWDIGPFVKHQEPVLRPTPESRFTCPVRSQEVRWEEQDTHPCGLARSENLIDWTPVGKAVWPGGGREAGAIALLRDDGILLMTQGGHHSLGAWVLRQALIDGKDLKTVLKEQKEPFLYPEYDWEKQGFTGHTTVANGMVPFKGQWLLYYGAADRVIGLATCPSH